MSSGTHSSEESPKNRPFAEPQNLTTIELDNWEYSSEDRENNENDDKHLNTSKIIKSFLIGTGLFILLGLCVTILMLLINKSNFTNLIGNRNISRRHHSPIIMFLDSKKKIAACKTSKTVEECCNILFEGEISDKVTKCTVQKVLNIFLQYEMEANKRPKRQIYDYEEQPNDEDYFFYYDQDFDERENQYTNEDILQYFYEHHVPFTYNEDLFFQEDISSERSLKTYEDHQTNAESVPSSYKFITETPNQLLKSQHYSSKLESNLEKSLLEPFSPSTHVPLKCSNENCTNIIEASIKINNLTDVRASAGQLKINFNDTNIHLKPGFRNTEKRISQGSDFEIKPTNDVQSLNGNKQHGPCFYPSPASYLSPSTNFDYGQIFRQLPINQNIPRQPLYIINPPIYPPLSLTYQGYNYYQNPQIVGKTPIQVAGAGGQFYICNPISTTTSNVVGLQGVEVRRTPGVFNLQDMVALASTSSHNNQTREALDCPFGTRACQDGSKCVHNRQVCDNEVNCNDASDEAGCSCKDRVGEIRWCDGYPDCPNNEDETNCFNCDSDEFSCDDWSRLQHGTCVPISQRCDGIRQCEITGKDEEDCSILSDHVGQHHLNKISNAVGFLHRNFKGKWYPTCLGAEIFSTDVCRAEAGPNEASPKVHIVPTNDNYPGPFLDVSPAQGLTLTDTCMKNKAAFVECPPIYCGLRLSISNPFRNTEVDTSIEEFLSRRKLIRKSNPEEIVGASRVVGGKPSQPTAWPWVVSVYKNGVFHCGGVVISDLWILTAAHCVDRFWLYYYEVQAGILRRFSYSPMEQSRWASAAVPHEDYDKKTLKNDIALMKLSKPLRFNRYVRPICLPSRDNAGPDFLHGPKPSTVCTTVGWGATVEHGADPDHLREVEIPISRCKHAEDKKGDEICAGLLEGGRDACQGDSGGPLMCQNIKNRSQWYLAGIVSHGEGCARPNEPGVYTRVSRYVGWIHDNINGRIFGRFPLQRCPGYVCLGIEKCLPKKRHCDKIVDCLFGDDETNCWHPRTDEAEIVGIRRNLSNLLGSDEASEESSNSSSTQREVDITPRHFHCEFIFQVISFEKKCDRVADCEDGTDESECLCVDYLRRYDKEAICDGVTHCRDLSDEMDCVKCFENEYLCRASQRCIPLESRCDGKEECVNAEDEWDCVALTDGETLILDSNLRPEQTAKGVIAINRFGVWRPLCTDASVDDDASVAANACDLLGFEEYAAFHKLNVEDKPLNVTIDGFERHYSTSLNEFPRCGGLFVRCLNVSLGDNIHKHHRDNITSRVELNTSPWSAVIYFDGKSKCIGTILNPHFIIAAKTCLSPTLSKRTYITALLGKGKAHLDVEGPHEQVVEISGTALVNGTDAVLLHTDQRIVSNRYVHPAETAAKSSLFKDQCVATGIENRKVKVVFLKPQRKCASGFWCFRTKKSYCKQKLSHPWSGVITCHFREGWHVAATYSNITDLCQFSKRQFARIEKSTITSAMGGDFEKIRVDECEGFRCTLGSCIKKSQVCDGLPDCRSSEDENPDVCLKLQEECHLAKNCTNSSACKWSEFKCPDGSCIPKTSFCDTNNDCKNLFDEPEECSCRTYFEVVHPEKICDGIVNCWDRSDENPAKCHCQFPRNITCGQTKLCISQEMICDGFQDCPNGEDESRCYTLKTDLANINSGEVMKNTAGIWHSACFSRNHTRSELEEICKRLGFTGGSARRMMPSKGSNSSAMNPIQDRFDTVWIRRGSGSELKLRFRTGNEPYVTLVDDPKCHKLFIECL